MNKHVIVVGLVMGMLTACHTGNPAMPVGAVTSPVTAAAASAAKPAKPVTIAPVRSLHREVPASSPLGMLQAKANSTLEAMQRASDLSVSAEIGRRGLAACSTIFLSDVKNRNQYAAIGTAACDSLAVLTGPKFMPAIQKAAQENMAKDAALALRGIASAASEQDLGSGEHAITLIRDMVEAASTWENGARVAWAALNRLAQDQQVSEALRQAIASKLPALAQVHGTLNYQRACGEYLKAMEIFLLDV